MSQGGKQHKDHAGFVRSDTAATPYGTRRVYVQIPAYRDRELLRTVQDLTNTAMNADRLRVAIAWQYGQDEAHLEGELRGCGQHLPINICHRSTGHSICLRPIFVVVLGHASSVD